MKSHGAKNAAAHLHSVDRMCSEIRSAYGQLFVPYLNRWGELALFGGRGELKLVLPSVLTHVCSGLRRDACKSLRGASCKICCRRRGSVFS